MNTLEPDVLLSHTSDRVCTLTLNRPEARNALSAQLRGRLFGALREAEGDPGVDVIILTGSDPAFCAGLDLRELSGEIPDLAPDWPDMTKPVIGAINGVAVTGGLEIALYCDILIASEQARFADTHTRVGLLPMWGMSVRLSQAVGRGLAHRMSLTGDYLSAQEARDAGLVTQVVPHDELLPTARRLAATIAANDQPAVRTQLSTYHQQEAHLDAEVLAIEMRQATDWLQRTDTSSAIADNREAVVARGRSQVTG